MVGVYMAGSIINLEEEREQKKILLAAISMKVYTGMFRFSYIHISFFIKLSFFFVSKSNFTFCTLKGRVFGKIQQSTMPFYGLCNEL